MENSKQPGNGHDIKREAAAAVSDATRAASELAQRAGEAVSETSHQVSDAYYRFAESSRECVRANPVTSVAIAVLAGWGLARLFTGSPRR